MRKIKRTVYLIIGILALTLILATVGFNIDTDYLVQIQQTTFNVERISSQVAELKTNAQDEREETESGTGNNTEVVAETEPTVTTDQPQPIYKQSDSLWSKIPTYNGGNIGRNGCGPTSVAMAMTMLTGTTITPLDLNNVINTTSNLKGACWSNNSWAYVGFKLVAEYYNSQGNYNIKVDSNASTLTKSFIQDALDSGCLVYMRTGKGWFTSDGHVMLITGYAGDRDHMYINNPSNGTTTCPAGKGSAYQNDYAWNISETINNGMTNPLGWKVWRE